MKNENYTVRSRQELKTLYNSGAITAEEYEAYKKRIIYGIAIPIKLPPATSAPAGAPASPRSVKPIETRIIYPTQSKTTKPPVTSLPAKEQHDYKERARTGVKPGWIKKWVLISLTVLGALSLLNLLAYQFFNKPQSERLTSKSGTEAEKIIPVDRSPENMPVGSAENTAERSNRIPQASTENMAVTLPKPTPENTINSDKATTYAAGLLTDNNEIIRKAQEKLQAYYTDMQAAPFKANQYFAPQVERYYTLMNTTPMAISKSINTYHFPEFLNGQSSIQEGSMEVVNSNNNYYELTYLEHGSAFRKSRNQQQEVTAKVRIRFNPDFKITYFRQERLLKNQFLTK